MSIPLESRRFRFGIEMIGPFADMSWADSARELEELGYSTLFVPDHFDEGLGPLVAMATAAVATRTLTVAPAVLCTDFRHPTVVARELASIDRLSGGRLEIGLGAGYQVNDYLPTGIAMDPPRVRVDRLIEYVDVLRGLFAEGPFSFDGEHFQIRQLDGSPSPARPGGPPIMVAGGGRRMLRFAARNAEIVGVNASLPSSESRAESRLDWPAERIDAKFDLIREAAGPRFDLLTFHAWVRYAMVTSDPRGYAESVAAETELDVEALTSSPFFLAGDVEEIVEMLLERRARWGYSYYTLQQTIARDFAPVLKRIAEMDR
jgi:probable F420-dependent oxidoreductase